MTAQINHIAVVSIAVKMATHIVVPPGIVYGEPLHCSVVYAGVAICHLAANKSVLIWAGIQAVFVTVDIRAPVVQVAALRLERVITYLGIG